VDDGGAFPRERRANAEPKGDEMCHSRFWTAGTAILLASTLIGCGAEPPPVGPDDDATLAGITIQPGTPRALTALGDTVTLTARGRTLAGDLVGVTPTWTSDAPEVATVDAGKVAAVANGSATITARRGSVSTSVEITVEQEVSAIRFGSDPADGHYGRPLPAFEVELVDGNGHTATNAEHRIALSLGQNPTGATLTGTTARDATAGVARFSALEVDRRGNGYTLTAAVGTLAIESASFAILQPESPFETFQAASLVIGQPDAESHEINRGGGSDAVDAHGFRGPKDVAYEGRGGLWIADALNARVLYFGSSSPAPNEPAKLVIGNPDFKSVKVAVSAETLAHPTAVATWKETLAVADEFAHRVLIWNELPTENGQPADVVVGQSSFTGSGFGSTATTLIYPADVAMPDGRLIVADEGNNRVLIWNEVPSDNGAPDMRTSSHGISASKLRLPTGVWSDGRRLVVADRGNDRVLVWSSVPTSNGAPADFVLGASRLDEAADTASFWGGFGSPRDVVADDAHLFVLDAGRSRVLVFPFPDASGLDPVVLLGQSAFDLFAPNDPNQDGESDGVASSRTLSSLPYGLSLVDGRLFLSDAANNRVLVFEPR